MRCDFLRHRPEPLVRTLPSEWAAAILRLLLQVRTEIVGLATNVQAGAIERLSMGQLHAGWTTWELAVLYVRGSELSVLVSGFVRWRERGSARQTMQFDLRLVPLPRE